MDNPNRTNLSQLIAWLCYLALASVLCYPFLVHEYLFAADQYVHGYNTCVLEQLQLNPTSYYSEWFRINTFPEPNWIGHGLLWVLAKALPMYLAEKAFVLLIVLGNGYAFLTSRSALTTRVDFRPGTFAWPWKTATALLSLVFLFGAIWQLGFVNYLLGMVAVIAGLTHTSKLKTDRRLAVVGWGLFTYFCHPIAFLFFMGTFSLRELLGRELLSPYLMPQPGDWASFIKRFLVWFGLPLLLLVAYLATHSEVSTLKGASPWRLLGLVYYHNDIALFHAGELLFGKLALIAGLVTSIFGVFLLRQYQKAWTLGAVGSGVLLGAIVFSPDYFAGGALIHQRLLPIVFVWAFWCAAHAYNRQSILMKSLTLRLGIAMAIATTVTIVGLTSYRNQALPAIVEVLDEFREFSEKIPPGSSVLPVSASATAVVKGQELSLKPVLHHYAANLDCKQNIVLLDNYEAYVGYFPLLWKDGKNPYSELSSGLEEHPARIQITGAQWMGNNVDFILTMGSPEEAFDAGTSRWLMTSVREVGDLASGEQLTSKNGNFHLLSVDKETLSKASF